MSMDDDTITRALDLSDRLEKDLAADRGGVVVALAVTARNSAIEAMRALVVCDAEDPKVIRALQNEARRYADMIRWMGNIVQLGRDAEAEITPGEVEEIRHALNEEVNP